MHHIQLHLMPLRPCQFLISSLYMMFPLFPWYISIIIPRNLRIKQHLCRIVSFTKLENCCQWCSWKHYNLFFKVLLCEVDVFPILHRLHKMGYSWMPLVQLCNGSPRSCSKCLYFFHGVDVCILCIYKCTLLPALSCRSLHLYVHLIFLIIENIA